MHNNVAHQSLRHICGALSPGGRRARLQLLIFHRILRRADAMQSGVVDAASFEWQMQLLKRYFNVLPLVEACDRLHSHTLPARAVAITFDDGYVDNVDVALPILSRLGLPATFFIATGFLDGGRMWSDTLIEWVRRVPGPELDMQSLGLGRLDVRGDARRGATARVLIDRLRPMRSEPRDQCIRAFLDAVPVDLPAGEMMTSAQVNELARRGMEIGAHTVNHTILTQVEDGRARWEIVESKRRLEEITGSPVVLFAYPNGKRSADFAARHVGFVREAGFRAAVSTDWGVSKTDTDRFSLPRFTPWHKTPLPFHLALLRNYLGPSAGGK